MEMSEKFYLPCCILETKNFKEFCKNGKRNPFEQNVPVIYSYQFAAKNSDKILTLPWNLAIIDESHRLRNVYKPDNKIAKSIKTALMNTPKILNSNTSTKLTHGILRPGKRN